MDIQNTINELEKERARINEENERFLDTIMTIQDSFSEIPSSLEESKKHPATKYFADKFSENRNKSAKIYKAIKALKAIL